MSVSEKPELVRHWSLYHGDLLKANEKNIQEAAKHKGKRWEGDYTFGVKAQYEHARIISTKLSVEVGKEMKSYWQL